MYLKYDEMFVSNADCSSVLKANLLYQISGWLCARTCSYRNTGTSMKGSSVTLLKWCGFGSGSHVWIKYKLHITRWAVLLQSSNSNTCVELCIGLSVHLKMWLYVKWFIFCWHAYYHESYLLKWFLFIVQKKYCNLQVWQFYEYFTFSIMHYIFLSLNLMIGSCIFSFCIFYISCREE